MEDDPKQALASALPLAFPNVVRCRRLVGPVEGPKNRIKTGTTSGAAWHKGPDKARKIGLLRDA